MTKLFGMGSALALFCVAGTVNAQCTTYTRTTGTGTIEAGIDDIGNHGDDVTTTVALPFTVTFYGVAYNSVNLCSNGWASFAATNTGYANVCIPNITGAPDFDTVPGPTIFGHWDDLSTTASGNGIFTSTTGSPGSRTFNIEWRTARLASATSRVDFSMRLYEGSPRIDILYTNIVESGASATAGILNSDGTYDEFACNAGGLTNGLMLTYNCDLTNPSGGGSATPNFAYPNRQTLITVSALGAQTPPSTGLAVQADLSAIGGSATQVLVDNGTQGDVTAGDNVFSYLATVSGAATPGAASMPFVLSDAQGRTFNGAIGITVGSANEWNETVHGSGDAGELVSSAQSVDLSGSVLTIRGALGTGDADMYKLHLCTPGSFSASTVGGTTVDTQLFLFRADGTGIVMDDDDATPGTTHLQSLLSNTYTASLAAGDYYMAISQWDKDPLDASGNQLWLDLVGGSYRVEHAPDDVGAANPMSFWSTTTGVGGAYVVTLGGISGASCGPVCGTSDFNGDTDFGTDQDIEAFFACLAGFCCPTCYAGGSDFNGDGDFGTDQDIEAFFRVLAGGNC